MFQEVVPNKLRQWYILSMLRLTDKVET